MLACILFMQMLLFHHVNVHNSFSKVNCNKEFEFEFEFITIQGFIINFKIAMYICESAMMSYYCLNK